MGPRDWVLAAVVVVLLSVATAIGQIVKRQPHLGLNAAAIATFNRRLGSWWIICALLGIAFISPTLTVGLFGLMSFWALREFITLTPTRLGDHRALFWVFFIFTPLQYVAVDYNNYAFFSILIPVYAFLFIPARIALAGDFKRFLERVAKIQSGLLICVYCLSFAPALLYMEVPKQASNANARLLFFFVTMALLSEAFQFLWSQLYGRHVIAPSINAARTWEGLVGGSASTALAGMLLYWATPFSEIWQVAFMSMVVAVMGFAGAMTMSAIKRDRGVRDYGTLVEGHGGVLDRIDAICFAAPVFYHVTRQILRIP
ncbi:MAG TPA: phosphatidate cytidylyltransferase [Lacipirellulaceae bacterium]|nr:phosphatidate cytidylyltransferase [Lacipirellulaceae bacterium]